MTLEEKKKQILDNIWSNYDDFTRQSYVKLNRKIAKRKDDHIECVWYVLEPIFRKLDNKVQINKFYDMLPNDGLYLYILRAINTNAKIYTAPFLRDRIKELKTKEVSDNHMKPDEGDEDLETDLVVNHVLDILEKPERSREVFGSAWKYYSRLFNEYYIEKKCTYKSLSMKYGIPAPTLAKDMLNIKEMIRNDLKTTYGNRLFQFNQQGIDD